MVAHPTGRPPHRGGRDEDRTFVRERPALLADEDLAIIR
jgi:hypothetical protein